MSYSPVSACAKLMKTIGPVATTVLMTKVESTTMKTEQRARQKLQLCLETSLKECLTKNRDFCQHPYYVGSSSSSSRNSSGVISLIVDSDGTICGSNLLSPRSE